MPSTTNWRHVTNDERLALLQRHDQGESIATIAASVGMNPGTLERRLRDFRRGLGGVTFDEDDDGLDPLPGVKKANSLEDWWMLLEHAQRIITHADPIQTQAEIMLGDKPVAVMFTSCWHLGSRFTAYAEFREILNKLLETDRFYIGIHGDEIDNFGVSFPSAEAVFNQLIPPKYQRQMLAQLVNRLAEKKKALYACWSNHPGFDERKLGENLVKPIYAEAGIPYFDGKGTIRLKVGEQEYLLYVAHEFKGQSQWNRNHAQVRALTFEMPGADLVVMGDKHTAGIHKVPHHVPAYDAGLHESMWAWLVQTGTAKSGPDLYSIRNWTHGIFEWPVFVFMPNEHSVFPVERLKDLDYFLGG